MKKVFNNKKIYFYKDNKIIFSIENYYKVYIILKTKNILEIAFFVDNSIEKKFL